MINRLKKMRLGIAKLFGVITGFLGATVFILTMTAIISRLVAGDIDWIFEGSRILLMLSVATGAFVASLQNDHFRVVLGGKGLPGIEKPSFVEALRQAVIIACLGLLFIVGIPTIEKTKMHPLTTLPGDYSIFRIIYLAGIGGMLLAHVWSLAEITLRLIAGKKMAMRSSSNGDL
jgi:TRAP-type C4-dicarboxylate transport system permease small subunit